MVKYPWLQYLASDNRPVPTPGRPESFAVFSATQWDARTGTVVLTYDGNASRPPLPRPGTQFGFKHFENMQAGWGVFGWMVAGRYLLDGVTLRSCAGMGFRCDFCNGTFELRNSTIAPAAGRSMSSTADGVHLMHHTGEVLVRDSRVAGTGDDCFNLHGNFIVLSNISNATRRTSTYVDETGPGWIPAAPLYLVGDDVQFYSRLTLQKIGPPNQLLAASGGFWDAARLVFRDPIPDAVKRYDMFLSTSRAASLTVIRSVFEPGGRGLVVSGTDVLIRGNTFRNSEVAVEFIQGGCGAYEAFG